MPGKNIDTHNGGWKFGEGAKSRAPGKKRTQFNKARTGAMRTGAFNANDGKTFEQAIPSGLRAMMAAQRGVVEGKAHFPRQIEDGPDSMPAKQRRREEKKQKKKVQAAHAVGGAKQSTAGVATGPVGWISTEDGGQQPAADAAVADGNRTKAPERMQGENMQAYSRRLKAFTRAQNLMNIRKSLKSSQKSKGFLNGKRKKLAEKRRKKQEASDVDVAGGDVDKRAAKGDWAGEAAAARAAGGRADSGWAGQEQAMRPPELPGHGAHERQHALLNHNRTGISGLSKSVALSRLRAIEAYRKQNNRPNFNNIGSKGQD